jgi:hypothetical protein
VLKIKTGINVVLNGIGGNCLIFYLNKVWRIRFDDWHFCVFLDGIWRSKFVQGERISKTEKLSPNLMKFGNFNYVQ